MTVWEFCRETQQRTKRERFGGGVGGRGLYLNPAPPLSPGRELGRQGGSCIRKPPARQVSVRDCGGGVLSICDNIEDHASEFCSEPLSVNHCIPAAPTPFFETDAPAPASGPPLQRETSCRSASRPGVIDSATHEPQPTQLDRDCRPSSSSGPTPDDQDSQTVVLDRATWGSPVVLKSCLPRRSALGVVGILVSPGGEAVLPSLQAAGPTSWSTAVCEGLVCQAELSIARCRAEVRN